MQYVKKNQTQKISPGRAADGAAPVMSQMKRLPSGEIDRSALGPTPRLRSRSTANQLMSPDPAFARSCAQPEQKITFEIDRSRSTPVGFQPGKLGRLLNFAVNRLENERRAADLSPIATYPEVMANLCNMTRSSLFPVVLKMPTKAPESKESWNNYKARMEEYLEPVRKLVGDTMGMNAVNLLAANAIKFKGTLEQIKALSVHKQIAKIELDPMVKVTAMDDVYSDLRKEQFIRINSGLDGRGVRVAVLDSGIDTKHPYLRVAGSVSTCDEQYDIPGAHGTHCAGVIASTDLFYRGVAPGVELLNVKVLQADGCGSHTNIVKGIDVALDMGADIISMSLAFNHLPSWAHNGHNWQCDSGHCPLCVAVDNVVKLDNVIVVAAAGNDHLTAEFLRNNDYGGHFDTESGCPGQCREAITVGAVSKGTFSLADFSSRGSTSYGITKPNLWAPGVNVMSTVPVRRDIYGRPVANPRREDLFAKMSGTSIATPIVAGVVALIVEKIRKRGQLVGAKIVKDILYGGARSVEGNFDVIDLSRL